MTEHEQPTSPKISKIDENRDTVGALPSDPGLGDDIPCVKCGGALDTGLECTECGYDNYEAVMGKPFAG